MATWQRHVFYNPQNVACKFLTVLTSAKQEYRV